MRAMQKTEHGWTIIDADAGVLSYSYEFSKGATSNCFTTKLASGGLMVVSPPTKVSQEVVDDLAAYGKVEALVANNGYHHLGIARWRELFPAARCFAAAGAKARIAKRSNDAGELEGLDALEPLLGEGVAVLEAASSKCGETWVRAKLEEGGYAWYGSDIFANMPSVPPSFFVGLLFKWTGSAPGYRLFNLAHKLVLKDRKATLRAMLEDVRRHPPRVMVPAHGEILSSASLATDTERLLTDAVG
jgi:hypothetical protein